MSNTDKTQKADYSFSNKWLKARERLRLLDSLQDPTSIDHLHRLGVSAGWTCLEVGAGSGSIAEWLCKRVGPSGAVVATDLETRFIKALKYPNLDVRTHAKLQQFLFAKALSKLENL